MTWAVDVVGWWSGDVGRRDVSDEEESDRGMVCGRRRAGRGVDSVSCGTKPARERERGREVVLRALRERGGCARIPVWRGGGRGRGDPDGIVGDGSAGKEVCVGDRGVDGELEAGSTRRFVGDGRWVRGRRG